MTSFLEGIKFSSKYSVVDAQRRAKVKNKNNCELNKMQKLEVENRSEIGRKYSCKSRNLIGKVEKGNLEKNMKVSVIEI